MHRTAKTAVGVAVAATASLALTACQGVAGGGGGEGSLSSWQGANYLPETNSFSRALAEVTDFLQEENVAQVELFHQEALLGAEDILPGVADGRANIGLINPFYYPGELPLSNVAGVPFVSQDPWAHNAALNELYENNEELRAEFEQAGVHLITFIPVTTNIVGTQDEIETLEDFNGKRLRAVGLVSEAVSAVGASPVSLPAPEIYQSVEQGVIDGYTSYPFDISVDNSFHEVAPHFLDPGTGVYGGGAIIINQGDWDALTDEQRSAIESNRTAFADSAAQMVAEDIDSLCEEFLEAGGMPSALPEEEVSEFQDQVGDSLVDSWKNDATNAGVEEAAVDSFFEDLQAGVEQYEAESQYDLSMGPCIEQAE